MKNFNNQIIPQMSSTPPQLKSKVTMDVTEKIAKEDYKSSDDSSSKVDEEDEECEQYREEIRNPT